MLAHDVLNGPGTSPVQLLAADPAAQFTAPNQISNQYVAISLNGNADLTDTTSVQGVAYYRYFLQRVSNGNAPNDTPCNDGSGSLCSSPGVPSTTLGGATILDFLNGGPYSELDLQTTNTNAYGASAQITNTDTQFGLKNHALAGVSFDGAQTLFSANSYIGGLTPVDRVFIGPGTEIDEPGINSPVRVAISNANYGVYASDTLNLTPRLAVTLATRFNATMVDLSDQNGVDLSGTHSYLHFNPAAGVTYQVTPWLSTYAGYAVANRAPTPAELSCAGPQNSCSLANFFCRRSEFETSGRVHDRGGCAGNSVAVRWGEAELQFGAVSQHA
jgi:iron complex outermembrane recepter protein